MFHAQFDDLNRLFQHGICVRMWQAVQTGVLGVRRGEVLVAVGVPPVRDVVERGEETRIVVADGRSEFADRVLVRLVLWVRLGEQALVICPVVVHNLDFLF